MPKPEDVLDATTDEVRSLIGGILEIEREYENKKNLHLNKSLEKDIGDRIVKLIEKEISK